MESLERRHRRGPVVCSTASRWTHRRDAIDATGRSLTLTYNADNDGYALDPHFACELVGALEARDSTYVVAAPMLYESKADGSLAAHATQTKLRWQDGYVRHDHSIARALNRGRDFPEGDQTDFLEDHGFVVRTSAIGDLVDPHAAYTLEYLDMILSLKAQNRRVVFVPTARLEFRIAEFSWRDVPYFMYKRSEATCHGTRDYLARKWRAHFPNTGFWTYIKYTIVESHTYASLETLPLKYQLQLFLAFFQMAGYNRYDDRAYVEVLEAIDGGTLTTLEVNATRLTQRKPILDTVRKNATASDLLPQVGKSWLPALEADLPLEYMPFATMVFASPFTCDVVLGDGPGQFPRDLCGVAVEKGSGGEHFHDGDCHSHDEEHGHDHGHDDHGGCECYVNLPTFKSRNWVGDVLARAASILKVPSRVTTYLELFLGSDHAAAAHVAPLIAGVEPIVRGWALEERDVFTDIRLYTCCGAATATSDVLEPCPAVPVAFGEGDRVVHFSGRPAAPGEVVEALAAL